MLGDGDLSRWAEVYRLACVCVCEMREETRQDTSSKLVLVVYAELAGRCLRPISVRTPYRPIRRPAWQDVWARWLSHMRGVRGTIDAALARDAAKVNRVWACSVLGTAR